MFISVPRSDDEPPGNKGISVDVCPDSGPNTAEGCCENNLLYDGHKRTEVSFHCDIVTQNQNIEHLNLKAYRKQWTKLMSAKLKKMLFFFSKIQRLEGKHGRSRRGDSLGAA